LLTNQVANEPRPKTTWSLTKPAFSIILPNKSTFHAASSGSGFQTDFDNLFDDSKPSVSNTRIEESFSRDDEWSNIESVADSRSVQIRTVEEPEVPDILPSLHTLPRPDLLFTATTPYLMQISYSGGNGVTIFGSHEPSLRLLSEYLQRWIKVDPQDVRKACYLLVNHSTWGWMLTPGLTRSLTSGSSFTNQFLGWVCIMIGSLLSRLTTISGIQ
jgi:hypothetical protein